MPPVQVLMHEHYANNPVIGQKVWIVHAFSYLVFEDPSVCGNWNNVPDREWFIFQDQIDKGFYPFVALFNAEFFKLVNTMSGLMHLEVIKFWFNVENSLPLI